MCVCFTETEGIEGHGKHGKRIRMKRRRSLGGDFYFRNGEICITPLFFLVSVSCFIVVTICQCRSSLGLGETSLHCSCIVILVAY